MPRKTKAVARKSKPCRLSKKVLKTIVSDIYREVIADYLSGYNFNVGMDYKESIEDAFGSSFSEEPDSIRPYFGYAKYVTTSAKNLQKDLKKLLKDYTEDMVYMIFSGVEDPRHGSK